MEGISDSIEIPNEREAWQQAKEHFKKYVFNRSDAEMSRILTLVSHLKPIQELGLSLEQRYQLIRLFKFRVAEPNESLLSLNGEQVMADGTIAAHSVKDTESSGVTPHSSSPQAQQETRNARDPLLHPRQFFIIVHGCVTHYYKTCNGRVSRELHKGEHFGSPLLMEALPDSSSYVATERTELLTLSTEQFEKHLRAVDELELANRIKFFRSLIVPVLASWSDEQIEQLARSVFPMHYASRTVAIREGDDADCCFFLHQGKMKVVREIDFTANFGEPCAKLLELATLTSGEYFGELALLRVVCDGNKFKVAEKDALNVDSLRFDTAVDVEDETDLKSLPLGVASLARQATVYAHTPSDVYVLSKDKFIALFHGSALIRLREYAKGYPTQSEIKSQFFKQQQWSAFKDQVMNQVASGASDPGAPTNSTERGSTQTGTASRR